MSSTGRLSRVSQISNSRFEVLDAANMATVWYTLRQPIQGLTALVGVAFWALWGWGPGLLVAALTFLAWVETRVQLRSGGSHLALSLALDATLIAAGIVIVELPVAVVPVPFLANAASTMMLVPVRRAIWVWLYGFLLMGGILTSYSFGVIEPLEGLFGLVVAVVAAAIFGGQLLSLIAALGDAVQHAHHARVATLQESIRAQNDLIASVSHELRTPLTSILGFSAILDEGEESLESGESRSLVGVLHRESLYVSQLVDDLLTHAQSQRGSVPWVASSVQLDRLVGEVVENCRTRDEEVRLGLSVRPARAWADPLRVGQIVRNLLSNAVRYGGGLVVVDVGRQGDMAEVSIEDDGPGLSPSDEGRAFRAFERGESDNALPGSLGLGLHVSTVLAEAMGGAVTYRRVGDRTRFTLSLPIDPSDGVHDERVSVGGTIEG